MPRTAMGMVKTRKGEWMPFVNPGVPFVEALAAFRELQRVREHPDFEELHFQASDDTRVRILRFHPPTATPTRPAKKSGR